MKFNFLGGQHKGFSPNQNTQETVNMFLEVDSSEENKLTLYRVDGKKDFIELPKSPIYNMADVVYEHRLDLPIFCKLFGAFYIIHELLELLRFDVSRVFLPRCQVGTLRVGFPVFDKCFHWLVSYSVLPSQYSTSGLQMQPLLLAGDRACVGVGSIIPHVVEYG